MTRQESDQPRPDPDDVSELDSALRRLFADERLALPVSRDAGAAVVAGARRRRRNRMVLATSGGVLAIVAVFIAAAGLSGLVHPGSGVDRATAATHPVLSTTVTTSSAPPVTAPPSAQEAGELAVLGPYGYGDLQLGMPWQKVTADGALRQVTKVDSAGCLRYTLVVGPTRTVLPAAPATPSLAAGTSTAAIVPGYLAVEQVVVSVRDGVVELIAGPMLRTPEGIGVGSSREDLLDAYPKLPLPDRGGSASVAVDDNPIASYQFEVSNEGYVTSFSLRLTKSDCIG